MGGRVFLTGGSGYFGGALLQALLADGCSVRALVRKTCVIGPHPQVEEVRGDLLDNPRLASEMRGCDAVFHAAALVASWRPDESEFYRTNVEGFRTLLGACRQAEVPTLVYTSSFFALGPAGSRGANEQSTLEGRRFHPYQHSKLLARRIAVEALSQGIPIVILYPGVIYGPGPGTQGNLVGRLIGDFLGGRVPGLLGEGRQIWSYAFIDDVARGHLLARSCCPRGGEFVLGGENVSMRDFFGVLGALTGKPVPRLHIPLGLGMTFGGIQMIADRLRGRPPSVTPASVRMMHETWACDSTRAESVLGYRSRPLRAGLIQTLESAGIPIRGGQ